MCQSTMACVGQWEVVFVVREEYGGVFLSRGKPLRWAFRFQFMHPPWKMLHPPSKSAIAPLQLFNESTYKIILIFIVCLAEQTTNVSVHHGLCGPMGGSAGQPGPGSADSDQSQGVITLAAIIVINRCVTYMLNIFQTWFVTEYLTRVELIVEIS